jgi:putative ABC transport system substrate-binding protein
MKRAPGAGTQWRLALAVLATLAFAAPLAWGAETTTKKFGILAAGRPEPDDIEQTRMIVAPFGWIDGKNLAIVVRYDQDDQAQRERAAAELVGLAPDVILTAGSARTRALQRATSTIPIVSNIDDPVAEGFSTSLIRPSGNITGLAYAGGDVEAKEIQLLMRLVPHLKRIGYFYPTGYGPAKISPRFAKTAKDAGVKIEVILVGGPKEFAEGLETLRRGPKSAAYVNGVPGMEPRELAARAREARIPILCEDPSLVEAGALISYVLAFENRKQHVGSVIDKLLRGARPAEIPFELPRVSSLVVNRATAKALGIEIPADILVAADKVVD